MPSFHCAPRAVAPFALVAASTPSMAVPRTAGAQGWIEPLPGRPVPVGEWGLGRLFPERDGVSVESAKSSSLLPLVTVKLFSRAWFDLLTALPDLAPAARELGRGVHAFGGQP